MKMFLNISKIILFSCFLYSSNCLNQTDLEQLYNEVLNSSSNSTEDFMISILPIIDGKNDKTESNETNITITTQLSATDSKTEDTSVSQETTFLPTIIGQNNTNESIDPNFTTTIQLSTTNSTTEDMSVVLETTLIPIIIGLNDTNESIVPNITTINQMLTNDSTTEDMSVFQETTLLSVIIGQNNRNESIDPNITTTTELSKTNYSTEDLSLYQTPTVFLINFESNEDSENMSHISTVKTMTTTEYTLDENQLNITQVNQTKTLEEIFEEEQKRSNDSNLAAIEVSTESNEEPNITVATEIIAAGPGIPIFREPPAFKIDDPDEGPMEPFLHPSNDSDDDQYYPHTETSGQKFILMPKPDFEPEKGSLEETYKHLLIDNDDQEVDDISLEVETDIFTNDTKTLNETLDTTTTTTTPTITMSPNLWQPIQPPFMFQPSYPYSYNPYNPYTYNPYYGGYQPYWPPYYPNGYPSPYLPPVYPNIQSNDFMGADNLEKQENNYNESNSNVDDVIETTEEYEDLEKKLLPKSFSEYGAYITGVTLDEKQSKEIAPGDEDSLEALGPIELIAATTTVETPTLPNEIRFLINQQNVNQMNRSNRKKVLIKKKKKPSVERPVLRVHTNVGSQLDSQLNDKKTVDSSERQPPLATNQRRVINRRRKVIPKSRDDSRLRRVKVQQRIIRIQNNTDHNSNSSNNHMIRGNARMPTIRSRVNKVRVKLIDENQNQRQEPIEKDIRNHEMPSKPKVDKQNGFELKIEKNVSEPDWKRTTKPTFLLMAKIKDLKQLKVDSVTGIKWWHQEQPRYCSEPIFVLSDCANRRLAKRWSYNPVDEKCYLYEDYCSHFKANSFETSKECFRKCYRIKE